MRIGRYWSQGVYDSGNTALICQMETPKRIGFEGSFVRGHRIQGGGEEVEELVATVAKAPAFLDTKGDQGQTGRLGNWKPGALLDAGTLVGSVARRKGSLRAVRRRRDEASADIDHDLKGAVRTNSKIVRALAGIGNGAIRFDVHAKTSSTANFVENCDHGVVPG